MCVFLYLFGAKLVRAGAFSPDDAGRRIRRRLLGWGLAIGVPLNLLPLVPIGHPAFQLVAGLDRYIFAIILAVGYIGLVALFLEKGWLPWLQGRLEDIGKTALSCYMLQNVLGCALFYGWGLGLGRFEVGSLGTVAAWAAISAALALFAHLWLKHFPTGPFEMVWRRLSALAEPGRRT